MHKQRYLIRGEEPEFIAGSTLDGRQALIGSHSPSHVIAIFFDRNGRLLGYELREIAPEPAVVGDNPHDRRRLAKLTGALRKWQSELGFIRGPIEVWKFNCEGVKVEDLPEHYQDFLANAVATEPDKTKWPEWRELIQRWRDRGMFVLWWGKDYWMDAEGNVEST
jgi:hypothetical protein